MPHSTVQRLSYFGIGLGPLHQRARVGDCLHCGSGPTGPTHRPAAFTSKISCIFGRQSASVSDIGGGIVAAVRSRTSSDTMRRLWQGTRSLSRLVPNYRPIPSSNGRRFPRVRYTACRLMCSSYAVIEALGQRCHPPGENCAGWIHSLA